MNRAINWFEIPTTDFHRAIKFYETVLEVKLHVEESTRMRLAIFPYPEGGTGGGLAQDGRRKPSAEGTLVYLEATGKLDAVLERVTRAGGRVVLPKTDIGEPGAIAIVIDSEGNAVGFHSERVKA